MHVCINVNDPEVIQTTKQSINLAIKNPGEKQANNNGIKDPEGK